jgi:benzoate/toluate 1,2-dioxygenase reductase component
MDKSAFQSPTAGLLTASVTGRKWLSTETFEIRFERPPGFEFIPGQKIELVCGDIHRTYSLISAPRDRELAICARHIPHGKMTPLLAAAAVGEVFRLTPAFGFFVFQSSRRAPVFVATGTGIAPFVAFVRSGVRGFRMLHGARHCEGLYYRELLASAARVYTPCLSSTRKPHESKPQIFPGRVTSYLSRELPAAEYDFYLCGSGEMIRDVINVIDNRFPTARVFAETFY